MKNHISSADFKKGAKGTLAKAVNVSAPVAGDAARTLTFVVSAALPDRDNDVLIQKGIELDNYRTNPQVLAFHDSDNWPVGKCIDIGINADGNLQATVQFVDAEVPEAGPRAEAAYQLAANGFLNAVSVGFLPLEWEWSSERDGGIDFKRVDLFEFSLVPIPCQPLALIVPDETPAEAEPDNTADTENKSINSITSAIERRKRVIDSLA